MNHHPKTRLGVDIGTNSIGWWLYATDGKGITGIIDGGVRIFSDGRDPKSGTSLAVDRRLARSMRRRRDRYLRCRTALMRRLVLAGLMPGDQAAARSLERLDPFELRARGLDEALPLAHLGRALFHINQRRGFKSNRKADRDNNESRLIGDASARLDQAMMAARARSYGEFLHICRSDKPEKPPHQHKTNKDGTRSDDRRTRPVRTRLSAARRDGAKKEKPGYDFYPDRRHLEEEFSTLWHSQFTHHQNAKDNNQTITAREWRWDKDHRRFTSVNVQCEACPDIFTQELYDALFDTVFFQRPLKTPEIGLCLFTGERRLPKAHPLTQRRVLYETVNSLRITGDGRKKRCLTKDERDQIICALDHKKPTKTLTSMTMKLDALGKVARLAPGERFTLETANRNAIACDPVRASLSHPDRFGARWAKLDAPAQWEVISRIRAVQSDAEYDELVSWLCERHGLDRDGACAAANAPLPEGHGRLGASATGKILEALKAGVLTYSDAVAACGWHHSDLRTGEIHDQLPYYGAILERHVIPGSGRARDDDITRFGRITNPTVHIGLNQLRRLVNRIICAYGRPDEIVVELARELKLSHTQKEEENKRISETTKAAKKRSEKLEGLGKPDTGANRMLLRLYEELGPAIGPRCCPYTGEAISVTMLFDGSCDVDHILPWSRTLDDSVANRTLCMRAANREKANRTPWESWGDSPQWDRIAANLKNLPENKRWRFAPDAMERFEGENDFLDRALTDTQYLSRMARSYLDALYSEAGHVHVVPGRLTGMLRRHWGLNSLLSDRGKGAAKAKDRTDHRHRAIDAAIIAATDRGLINRISKAVGRDEESGKTAEHIARKAPQPWEGFRAAIRAQLDRMIVSHRADHGRTDHTARKNGRDSTTGKLHNDTASGMVDDQHVVSRVELLSLGRRDIEVRARGKNIRDPDLQKLLARAVQSKEAAKEIKSALAGFAACDTLPDGTYNPYRGIRHVRMIESLQSSSRIEITDRAGTPYKAYKGDSNHCYEIWRLPDGALKAQVITTFEAHGTNTVRPHPAAKRLLRVFKRDMVAIRRNGERLICYVQSMHVANGLRLAPHNEANADARNRSGADPFRLIQMSVGPLVKAGIRRVFVDEIGRLRDPGPSARSS